MTHRGITAVAVLCLTVTACTSPAPAPEPASEPDVSARGPRVQPGTAMGLFTPEQHDLYDGRFIISGNRVYQVGTLADEAPWDHMGNDGSNLRPVGGTVEIEHRRDP